MNLARFFTGSDTTVASIVWPIVLGAFIAVVIGIINKRTIGKLIKKLLEAGANSPENAISLEECGLSKNGYLRYATRSTSTLMNLISATDDKKLYISEEKSFRAETTYVSDRASLKVIIAAAIILIAAGILLNNVAPKLISFATEIF
jgi:hypothetical protein